MKDENNTELFYDSILNSEISEKFIEHLFFYSCHSHKILKYAAFALLTTILQCNDEKFVLLLLNYKINTGVKITNVLLTNMQSDS